MKRFFLIVWVVTLVSCLSFASAEEYPRAYYKDAEKKIIVLENRFLIFEIDPEHGGF